MSTSKRDETDGKAAKEAEDKKLLDRISEISGACRPCSQVNLLLLKSHRTHQSAQERRLFTIAVRAKWPSAVEQIHITFFR